MKNASLMSGLVVGLSTFLLSAQQQIPPRVSLEVEVNPSSGVESRASKPESDQEGEQKPDVNEVIKNDTVFTNSVGIVLKKVGDLWVAVYETTQREYQEVMGSNPSAFAGETRPVDSVSWESARAFCTKLTELEKTEDMLPEGYQYVLPTQEQWEHLAAGVSLAQAVTSSRARRSGTEPVGSLNPTSAGIYDLRGNVAEWCADPSDGPYRVLRGGSWADWIEINLRPAFRVEVAPADAQNTYGFRCILSDRG